MRMHIKLLVGLGGLALVGAGLVALSVGREGSQLRRPVQRAAATAAIPPATARVGPQAAASRFAVAFWSFDWHDRPGAAGVRLVRCRPWVTSELWSALQATPEAPAFDASRRFDHEIDVVGPVIAVIEDDTPEAVGVAVSAAVTVQTDRSGVVDGRRDMELRVVDGGAGWRVTAVDL